MNRRSLLKSAFGGVAATGAIKVMGLCGLGATPEQPLGPFYPEKRQFDEDNDLTFVKGRSGTAKGDIIYLAGTVTDENCQPIKGALVEIWQACETGRYNHSGDPNVNAKLDPNFQYWGKDVSRDGGLYNFKTIVPGEYPANSTWVRPPHIHFKVQCHGYKELVTQLYFAGVENNKYDLILQSLSAEDKSKVVQPIKPHAGNNWVSFNIQLEKF